MSTFEIIYRVTCGRIGVLPLLEPAAPCISCLILTSISSIVGRVSLHRLSIEKVVVACEWLAAVGSPVQTCRTKQATVESS